MVDMVFTPERDVSRVHWASTRDHENTVRIRYISSTGQRSDEEEKVPLDPDLSEP